MPLNRPDLSLEEGCRGKIAVLFMFEKLIGKGFEVEKAQDFSVMVLVLSILTLLHSRFLMTHELHGFLYILKQFLINFNAVT